MVLRPRHFRAIELLVGTDLLQRDVAREVGVTRRTLGGWLKDDAFRAELARRRDAMPSRLEGLRMQTVRSLLLNAIRRLDADEEKPPLKEITQLLARVAGDEFATPSRGSDEQPDEDSTGTGGFELTPDQAERIWDMLEEDKAATEAAQAHAERDSQPA